MAIHLMLVGDDRPEGVYGGPDLGRIWRTARAEPEQRFFVERCASPDEVVPTARRLAREGMIDVVDLVDHGDPGIFRMGTGVLFDASGAGRHIARWLRPLLTPNARVRLLACRCAVGEEGQRLLLMLQRELGEGIAVHGALRQIDLGQFGPRGFKKLHEERFLFSATEAAARVAPSPEERADEVVEWYRSCTAGDVTPGHNESRS